MKTINYKGYDIEFNFYNRNEYTIQYCGDDLWFNNLDDVKEFIDIEVKSNENNYV